MSQNRANTSRVDEEININIINDCVRFVVSRENCKIPIKRVEIIKYLTTTNQLSTSQVNKVIIEANKILKHVYGYKLVQVEAKSGIQYIVLLTSDCDSLPSSCMDLQQRKLLVASLMHIYMSGGPIKEEDMWKFLSEANLLEEDNHAGRKILTETLVKQMYLQYSKVGEGELYKYVFEWGQRAIEEVPKMFLLKKMADAFDKSPDHWYEQFKEATEEIGQQPA